MDLTLRIVVALLAIIVFLSIISLLIRRKLHEKYTVIWLLLAVVVVIFALWGGGITIVAHLLGFKLGSNLVFFFACLTLLYVTLQLSIALTKAENSIRDLSESLALLENRVSELEKAKSEEINQHHS